jgi:hypothetical protein
VKVADVAVEVWHDIAVVLQSIIGNQGFAALFGRCIAVAARTHPWLAGSPAGEDQAVDFAALHALITQQSRENAAQGAAELLQTFHTILAGLIGTALSDQLLRSVRKHWRSRGSPDTTS